MTPVLGNTAVKKTDRTSTVFFFPFSFSSFFFFEGEKGKGVPFSHAYGFCLFVSTVSFHDIIASWDFVH